MKTSRKVRSIWISDFHLGTPDAKADYLLDFLRHHDSDYLYLAGDIFDGWALSRSWFWRQSHNDLIQKLLRKARKGTEVFYIPGNHDEFARDYIGLTLGKISIRSEVFHEMLDGRTFLVIHGDEFDGILRNAKWLSILGAGAYQLALLLNRWLNRIRLRLGKPYWSLSKVLKQKTKQAVQYVNNFEQIVASEARRCGVEGVICGHIHHPEIRDIDGITYANSGDWVESCSALVENLDGSLEIVTWAEITYSPEASSADEASAIGGDGHRSLSPVLKLS